MSEEEIMKELDFIKDLIKSEKYTFGNQYIKAIDNLININKELKEELNRQINTREIEEDFIEKNIEF